MHWYLKSCLTNRAIDDKKQACQEDSKKTRNESKQDFRVILYLYKLKSNECIKHTFVS